MATLDVGSIAQHAVSIGLVTDWQVRECQEDPECSPGDLSALLRLMERKRYVTPWQTQKLLKGEKDGYFLGGYRLLYKISSGSFGRVYRADDPLTGDIVAVKVLRNRWSENPHSVELFEREGKVGLQLQHENIVRILAVNRDPATRQYYMVMEFIEGSTLRDFLAIRKKLTPPEALKIIEDAAAGLAFAATKGMSHRDIKSTNVLITTAGVAKLVDFGLAGINAALGQPDDDTKVERTVDYAGLEKATNVKAGDPRSDIYFLGCVLYELLTGRSPLEMSKDRTVRMKKSRFEEVKPMSADEVQASPAVFHLVEQMMALNPASRFQTPQLLLEGVKRTRAVVEGKTGGAAGPGGTPTIFVVEPHEKLQEVIRARFKEEGFRVLMSADPAKAVVRYRGQPFDALIVDAGATGEEGLVAYREIMDDAQRMHHPCGGVLILSENQADWKDRLFPNPRSCVLVRPITLKQLLLKVCEMMAAQG